MTENYRDICELEPQESSDNSAAVSEASSVPWDGLLGADSEIPSAVELLSDNLAQNGYRATPRIEINRGEVVIARREVHLFPQSLVFSSYTDFESAQRASNRLGQHKRGTPSQMATDYDPSSPITTVITAQDPFRFTLGKVLYYHGGFFQSDPNDDFMNEEDLSGPFRIYNDRNIDSVPAGNIESLGLIFVSDVFEMRDVEIDDEFARRTFVNRMESRGFYTPADVSPDDYTMLQADSYLVGLFPSEEEYYEDTRFKAPASFFKSETNYISGFPGLYSSVSSYLPPTATPRVPVFEFDTTPAGQTPEFYQERSATRAGIPNIYADYLKKHSGANDVRGTVFNNQGNPIPRDLNEPGNEAQPSCDTVVEKYPAHAVAQLPVFNARIRAIEQGNPDATLISWLDNNSQGVVDLSFMIPKLDDNSVAAAIKEYNLSAPVLEWLDARFSKLSDTLPLFTSLHAYSLSQNVFDSETTPDDFYYSTGGQARYYSPNEKVLYNYRPRVIHNPLSSITSLFSETTAEDVQRPDDQIPSMTQLFKKEEFPLLFDGMNKMGTRQGRESFIGETLNAIENLRIRISELAANDGQRRLLDMSQIFSNALNHSEIIAFRVEKVNTVNGKVLKEFYFFSNPGTDRVNFIDNQVDLGGSYLYNIYAINFVFATKYRYKNVRPSPSEGRFEIPLFGGSTTPAPSVNFSLETRHCYKIIETPYFSQEVMIVDLPPVPPVVEAQKLGYDEIGAALFRFRLSPTSQKTIDRPLEILEGDEEVINKMKLNQSLMRNGLQDDQLRYSGADSPPSGFELIVLAEPPMNYLDFQQGEVHEIEASNPIYVFRTLQNLTFYAIFRTKDLGGISNPGHIYKFEYVRAADGDYYSFEVYEPELEIVQQRMTCERYLSVQPAMQQSVYNYGIDENSSQQEILEALETAPHPRDITVGSNNLNQEELIWNKRFKIRLKSVNTGKAIDLNFKFEKIVLDDSEEVRRDEFTSACGELVGNKNDTITRGLEASRQRIVEDLNQRGQNAAQRTLAPIDGPARRLESSREQPQRASAEAEAANRVERFFDDY